MQMVATEMKLVANEIITPLFVGMDTIWKPAKSHEANQYFPVKIISRKQIHTTIFIVELNIGLDNSKGDTP